MWPFHNSDGVTATNLVCLHVKCHGMIGGFVALTAQFFRPCFTHNSVIVDHGEFFASNADNYSNFICGTPSTENDEVMEFIAGQCVLTGGYLGGFLELRRSHLSEKQAYFG